MVYHRCSGSAFTPYHLLTPEKDRFPLQASAFYSATCCSKGLYYPKKGTKKPPSSGGSACCMEQITHASTYQDAHALCSLAGTPVLCHSVYILMITRTTRSTIHKELPALLKTEQTPFRLYIGLQCSVKVSSDEFRANQRLYS